MKALATVDLAVIKQDIKNREKKEIKLNYENTKLASEV